MQKNILRFTIDEKLDETLFRVLVSRLNKNVSTLNITSLDGWSEEKELLVTNLLFNKNIED